MARLGGYFCIILMVAAVQGLRNGQIAKRAAEIADDLRLENELKLVKRLQMNKDLMRVKRIKSFHLKSLEEPNLNRVKRQRRHTQPVQAYSMAEKRHFDPGLVRVKRMRRSHIPIKTKRMHEMSLSRMKRMPVLMNEREIQRPKRTLKKNQRRLSRKRTRNFHHVRNMTPRLRKVLKERREKRLRNRKHNRDHKRPRMFQTHRGVSPPSLNRRVHAQQSRRSDEKKPKRISKRM